MARYSELFNIFALKMLGLLCCGKSPHVHCAIVAKKMSKKFQAFIV